MNEELSRFEWIAFYMHHVHLSIIPSFILCWRDSFRLKLWQNRWQGVQSYKTPKRITRTMMRDVESDTKSVSIKSLKSRTISKKWNEKSTLYFTHKTIVITPYLAETVKYSFVMNGAPVTAQY